MTSRASASRRISSRLQNFQIEPRCGAASMSRASVSALARSSISPESQAMEGGKPLLGELAELRSDPAGGVDVAALFRGERAYAEQSAFVDRARWGDFHSRCRIDPRSRQQESPDGLEAGPPSATHRREG